MATKRATKAKKAARATPPAELEVRVRYSTNTYIARARGVTASSTSSESMAARVLATKLGYSKAADVRYVSRPEQGVWLFQIVELQP